MSGVQDAGSPTARAGVGGESRVAAPLPGLVTGLSGAQAPAGPGFFAAIAGVGGSNLMAALLPGHDLGVSGAQAPAFQGFPAGFAGVGV